MTSEWNGEFDEDSYAQARTILEADRTRVADEMKRETAKRARAVGIAAALWAVCSVAMAFANSDLLIVAELGWTAIVIWAVFYLIPTFMGKANLGDAFDQYGDQLDKLEEARIPMPKPSCMEDLVAAIDLVSPPETGQQAR